MPIGRDKARRARNKVAKRLAGRDWIYSIGTAKGEHGYLIVVTLDPNHPDATNLPFHVDGVEIKVRSPRTWGRVAADRQGTTTSPDLTPWSDNPIGIVSPEGEGPMYLTEDGILMLSPGRYTFSHVLAHEKVSGSPWLVQTAFVEDAPDAADFNIWLDAHRNFIKVLRKEDVLSTFADPPVTLARDYEFLVLDTVTWTLKGMPSWIPAGTDIVEYWGRGYRAPEVVLPELPSLPAVTGFLWAIAALGGIVLLAKSQTSKRFA